MIKVENGAIKHGAHKRAIIYTSITHFPPETIFRTTSVFFIKERRRKAERLRGPTQNVEGWKREAWFENKINITHHTHASRAVMFRLLERHYR
jgi:hypothetical protein